MTIEIVRGTNTKPVASDALVDTVSGLGGVDGQLMVGFPILTGAADTVSVDAVLISPQYGAVLFDLLEGPSEVGLEDRHDELIRLFQARLMQHRSLFKKRKLQVDLHVVTFDPTEEIVAACVEYPTAGPDSLADILGDLDVECDNETSYAALLSALQNISRLRSSRVPRKVESNSSRGAKLMALENSIATLDHMQSKAVLETIDGVQRIRGLAGSGKTIILALKAAYLHAQHPDWRVAVTYNTRSLRGQFVRLITNFSIEQSGEEPNWDKLKILNAWGGQGLGRRSGLYAEFCRANGGTFLDFRSASAIYGRDGAFDGACTAALQAQSGHDPLYDAILVDEAQDFPPSFLRLCYAMLTEEKRLVYAYDELQSLDGAGLPSASEIFGLDARGVPRVTFDGSSYDRGARRDIVLEKCYRNSRPVLVSAHALGFGIYREPEAGHATGIVQMFDQESLWHDIGYDVVSGDLAPGSSVVLERTEESSPGFLEEHSPIDDLIQFHRFDSREEHDEWVAQQVRTNLEEDELRHDDIVVVNPDGITARNNLAPIRRRLLELGVANHLAGVDTDADVFFDQHGESVTFTGIHRAKGNEAGMIYVVNAHEGMSAVTNLASVRNRLFTAITRSKAWVRVTGVGPKMDQLIAEYNSVVANGYRLAFTYPTERQRKELRIVHRETSKEQEKLIERNRTSAKQLVDELARGSLHVEDLDPLTRSQLLELLQGDGEA